MIKVGLAHNCFLICELIAVTCDILLLMDYLLREIGRAEQRSAAACLPIGSDGEESAICLCFVLLHECFHEEGEREADSCEAQNRERSGQLVYY